MAIIRLVEASPGAPVTYALQNPATLEPIGRFEAADAATVRAAVVRARQAQQIWAQLSYAQRAARLDGIKRRLVACSDQVVATIRSETSKAEMEALAEVIAGCDALQYYGKHAARLLRDVTQRPHLFYPMKKIVKTYHPRGVAGIITPWNFPLATAFVPAAQALMAGNAVLVKPSEVAPFAATWLEKLAVEAGLPEGLVQVLLGDGSTGAALIGSGVDKVHFTGSVRSGRLVGESCGRQLIPCTLELGGKDPAIVGADADLERAVQGVVNSALFNTGQACASTERVYVVEAIYDRFVAGLVNAVKALRQNESGDTDVSCMIWDRQLDIVERQLEDAVARGAKVLTGGRRQPGRAGLFLEPTVLVDVDHSMDVMRDETFGPVLPVMKVRDVEEAVRLANDSLYGLSASVWVGDSRNGLEIAKRLHSGGCAVNEFGGCVYGAHEGSFGGRKDSGIGYVNGELGLRSFCQVQHVLVHRFGPRKENTWFPYHAAGIRTMKTFMKVYFTTAIGRWLS